MVVAEGVISLVIVALSLALAIVGYLDTGGTVLTAIASARRVVARASSAAERLGGDSGRVVVTIASPAVGTYADARWLVAARGDTVDVSPAITPLKPTGQMNHIELHVTSADPGEHTIDITIFDAVSMQAVSSMSLVLPKARSLSLLRRLISKVPRRVQDVNV